MAKIININNGVGTGELINGSFTVTADVLGYDNSSINPNTIDIVSGTNSYNLTIAATGTLTLHVTDDGTQTGNPIVGATFARTDASGNVYGDVVTTNEQGNAVFNNVPFAATDAPIIYYKQTSSDGYHEFSDSIVNTTLTASTSTIEVQNSAGVSRTFNLTDANYANLPIDSATITFTS